LRESRHAAAFEHAAERQLLTGEAMAALGRIATLIFVAGWVVRVVRNSLCAAAFDPERTFDPAFHEKQRLRSITL
jgi:hypothetical protein